MQLFPTKKKENVRVQIPVPPRLQKRHVATKSRDQSSITSLVRRDAVYCLLLVAWTSFVACVLSASVGGILASASVMGALVVCLCANPPCADVRADPPRAPDLPDLPVLEAVPGDASTTRVVAVV